MQPTLFEANYVHSCSCGQHLRGRTPVCPIHDHVEGVTTTATTSNEPFYVSMERNEGQGEELTKFDGADYNTERDDKRLSGQMLRIWECMKDGHWRTLQAISDATNDPQPSISAQLRHFRKARFGSHTVNRRHLGNGLYEYQLIVNESVPAVGVEQS